MPNSATRPTLAATHRDLTVDTLRGIAILMVLVLHGIAMTIGMERHPRLFEAADRLGSGVQLFFVLSGFVIIAAMDRAEEFGDGKSGFLLRRAAKLMPLYLLFLHFNIAFFLWWSSVTPDPHFFRNGLSHADLNIWDYVSHLFLLQGFTPQKVNTYVDGSWSIVCEAYFYTLTPFIVHRVTRTIVGAVWALTASVVIAIVFAIVFGKYLATLGYFGYYAFPAQLPCFMVGVLCYRFRGLIEVWPPKSVQTAIACLLAVLLVGFARLIGAPLGGHVAIALLFAAALLTLRVSNGNGVFGWLQWFGRMSYALFLSHIFILKIAYSTIFMNGYDVPLLPMLAINLTLSIVVSAVLCWAVFDRIDRYFVLAMSRWLSKRRRSRPL